MSEMYYPGFDYVSKETAAELREKHIVPVDEATLRDLIETASRRPLTAAMNNVIAYRLGEVGLKLKEYPREEIGDEIDRGLVLRRLLEESGFYLITKG